MALDLTGPDNYVLDPSFVQEAGQRTGVSEPEMIQALKGSPRLLQALVSSGYAQPSQAPAQQGIPQSLPQRTAYPASPVTDSLDVIAPFLAGMSPTARSSAGQMIQFLLHGESIQRQGALLQGKANAAQAAAQIEGPVSQALGQRDYAGARQQVQQIMDQHGGNLDPAAYNRMVSLLGEAQKGESLLNNGQGAARISEASHRLGMGPEFERQALVAGGHLAPNEALPSTASPTYFEMGTQRFRTDPYTGANTPVLTSAKIENGRPISILPGQGSNPATVNIGPAIPGVPQITSEQAPIARMAGIPPGATWDDIPAGSPLAKRFEGVKQQLAISQSLGEHASKYQYDIANKTLGEMDPSLMNKVIINTQDASRVINASMLPYPQARGMLQAINPDGTAKYAVVDKQDAQQIAYGKRMYPQMAKLEALAPQVLVAAQQAFPGENLVNALALYAKKNLALSPQVAEFNSLRSQLKFEAARVEGGSSRIFRGITEQVGDYQIVNEKDSVATAQAKIQLLRENTDNLIMEYTGRKPTLVPSGAPLTTKSGNTGRIIP